MNTASVRTALFAIAATLLASACTSSDQRATAAASLAETAFNQGNMVAAKTAITRALAERDDVSEYWLTLAHIDVALHDPGGAMDAYRNVLIFDPSNREALSAICQLAIAQNDPERATKYADQLALLAPNDTLPQLVKAAVAFRHGDKAAATTIIDAALQTEPGNSGAIILKSKILMAGDHFVEAADLLEQTLKQPGNPDGRLLALKDLYLKTANRAGYRSVITRLAASGPDDLDRQIAYADLLYDEGQRDVAYAVTRRLLTTKPGDIAAATAVLNLWAANDAAVPGEAIVRDAEGVSLEGKATYAQYANERGRPDLARTILGPEVPVSPPNPANSDAKAAFAFSLGLRGDRASALAQLDAILAVDDAQPRALIARARLNGDVADALQDARRVVADDGSNVIARLTLVKLLLQQKDSVQAEHILREGLATSGSDSRVVAQLISLLRSQGRQDSATAALTDFKRTNPLSLRAARLGGGVGQTPPVAAPAA